MTGFDAAFVSPFCAPSLCVPAEARAPRRACPRPSGPGGSRGRAVLRAADGPGAGGEDLDLDKLRSRMRDLWARGTEPADKGQISGAQEEYLDESLPDAVWALVYDGEEKGIYSIRLEESGQPGRDVVLAFGCEDDAVRYRDMLVAQDFPAPSVVTIEMSTLTEFCDTTGHQLGFVPTGSLVTPPTESVENLADDLSRPELNDGSTSMSSEELESIRKRFNNLL